MSICEPRRDTTFTEALAARIRLLERRNEQKRKRIHQLTESRDYWKRLAIAAGVGPQGGGYRMFGPAHPVQARVQRERRAAS